MTPVDGQRYRNFCLHPLLRRVNFHPAAFQNAAASLRKCHPQCMSAKRHGSGDAGRTRTTSPARYTNISGKIRDWAYFRHFYFSHRPSPLLRGGRPVEVLERVHFWVGFRSVFGRCHFCQKLTKNRPKLEPFPSVRAGCASEEG